MKYTNKCVNKKLDRETARRKERGNYEKNENATKKGINIKVMALEISLVRLLQNPLYFLT